MTKEEFKKIFNIDDEELEKLITYTKFHFSETENMFEEIAMLDVKAKHFEPFIFIYILESAVYQINVSLAFFLYILLCFMKMKFNLTNNGFPDFLNMNHYAVNIVSSEYKIKQLRKCFKKKNKKAPISRSFLT